MIELDKLDIGFEEYEYVKLVQEGSCAELEIKALGFDIGISVEGGVVGLMATEGDAVIHHIYKSENPMDVLNDFIEELRKAK